MELASHTIVCVLERGTYRARAVGNSRREDKVEGTAVYDRQGEKLGSIHSVMIDKISGKVGYAVMSFGGFLGMGDRYHPLPWHVLTYDTSQGGYVVDLDRRRLEEAPTYGTSETPNWSDRRWGQQVHDYYGARPYWE